MKQHKSVSVSGAMLLWLLMVISTFVPFVPEFSYSEQKSKCAKKVGSSSKFTNIPAVCKHVGI